ncbi:SMI1/KNR4 family protein [Longispora sp. NPDC051575]|uniref:SMI1/KNR4 family protein n=1 Tax=Longispora sp. NPDC051575 TaxID=3154943 RepID=UPI00343ABF5E
MTEEVPPEERVRALVAMLADGTTATVEQFRGLSAEEIRAVGADQPAPLAAAYRCFLSLIGGGAGRFLRGSDVFHPDVLGLGEAARELLAENEVAFTLTDADRVILMHQGYQFDFLRGDGDDPQVWSYSEGGEPEDGPSLRHARFTDWLDGQVREQTEAWATLVPKHEAEQRQDPARVTYHRHHPDGSVSEGI